MDIIQLGAILSLVIMVIGIYLIIRYEKKMLEGPIIFSVIIIFMWISAMLVYSLRGR